MLKLYAKKGLLVRLSYLAISLVVWAGTLGGRLFGSRAVVLCYHGIRDRKADLFRRQMKAVSQRVVQLEELGDCSPRGFAKPSVVITFDDAFENLLTNAMQALEQLRIPASVYVVTDCVGEMPGWLQGSGHRDENEYLMSEKQLRVLAANPMVSIGSHSHTHPRLACLDRDGIQDELTLSRNALEKMTGQGVKVLAYPHGSYNGMVSGVAQMCGFSQRLTLDERMVHVGCADGEIGRFSMEPDAWMIEFRLTTDGAYFWLYYFRRMIRSCEKLLGK